MIITIPLIAALWPQKDHTETPQRKRQNTASWGQSALILGEIQVEYASLESDPNTIINNHRITDTADDLTILLHESLNAAETCHATGDPENTNDAATFAKTIDQLNYAWGRVQNSRTTPNREALLQDREEHLKHLTRERHQHGLS